MRAWRGSLGSLCGLGSLGPKGSLSGPGWGIWGLSLGQAGVSGNPGVSLSSRLGSLGCSLGLGGSSGVSAWVGLGSLGPQGSLSTPGRGLWGLSLGLLWVSEAFGTPRVFTFSVLAFPGPLGCLSGRAGVSVLSGVSLSAIRHLWILGGPLWAGLGSLGPKGSLSGPGWGLWGLSLSLVWVSEAFGALRAFTLSELGFPGFLGSLCGPDWGVWGTLGPRWVVWGLCVGRAGVSGSSGAPRVFTFSELRFWGRLRSLCSGMGFLGPPQSLLGPGWVLSGLSVGWGLWDPRGLFQGQAGVSGVFLWAKLGSLGSLGSLSGPGWGLWNPWGLCPGQDGVSGTPGVSIRVRMGSLGPLGCLFGPGRGLCVSLSRPCLGL